MEISFTREFDLAGRKSRKKMLRKSHRKSGTKSGTKSRRSSGRSTRTPKSTRQSGRRVHVVLQPGGFQDPYAEKEARTRTAHDGAKDSPAKDFTTSPAKLTTEVRQSYISRIAKLLNVSNDLGMAESERDRLGKLLAEARDMERWKQLAKCYTEQRSLQADVVELEQIRTELFARWGGAFFEAGQDSVDLFSGINEEDGLEAVNSFLNGPAEPFPALPDDEASPTKASQKADDDLSLMSRMIDLRATGLAAPPEKEMWQRISTLASEVRAPTNAEDANLSEVLLSYDMDPDDRSGLALMKLAYLTGTDPFELAMRGSPYESALGLENTFSLDITLAEREERCRKNVLQLRDRKETLSRDLSNFKMRYNGQMIPRRKEKNIYTEWLRLRNWATWRIRNAAQQDLPAEAAKQQRRKYVEERAKTWADLWAVLRDAEAERGRLASLDLEERDLREKWDELKERCSAVEKDMREDIRVAEQRRKEIIDDSTPEGEREGRQRLSQELEREITAAEVALKEITLGCATKPAQPEELAWYVSRKDALGKDWLTKSTEDIIKVLSAKPEYETSDLLDKSASELLDELIRVKVQYEGFAQKYQEGADLLQEDGFDILDRLHTVYVLLLNHKQSQQGRIDALKQIPGTGGIVDAAVSLSRFLKTTNHDELAASIKAYVEEVAKSQENTKAAKRQSLNTITTKKSGASSGPGETMAGLLPRPSRKEKTDNTDVSEATQVQAAENDMAKILQQQIKETEAAKGTAKKLMEDIKVQKVSDAAEQAKLRARIDELQNEHEKLKKDFLTGSDEARKQAEGIFLAKEESLGKEITELRAALMEASVRDGLRDKALDAAKKESREKQSQVEELQKKLQNVTKAVAEANGRVADLLRQRERESAAQEQVRAEQGKLNEAHEKQVAELRTRMAEGGANVKALTAELDKVRSDHNKTLAGLQKIITDEVAKTVIAENAAKAASKEIRELRDALSRQKDVSQEIQRNLEASQEEVKSLREKLKEMKDLSDQDARMRTQLTSDLQKTKGQLQDAERRLKEAEETARKYKVLVEKRERERDKALQGLRDAQAKLTQGEEREKEIKGKLNESERTRQVLEEKVHSANQKMAEAERRKDAEIKQHEKDINERNRVIKQLQVKEKVTDQELARLAKEAEQQATVLHNSQVLLQASRENERKLQETSASFEREVLAAREAAQEIERKLQQAIETGRTQRDALERAREEANARANAAEKERVKVETALQAARNFVNSLQGEVRKVTSEMQERIAAHEGSLRAEMEKARLKDIEHKAATEEHLRAIEEERVTVRNLVRESAEKERAITELRGNLVIVQREKDALLSEVQGLKREVSNLEKSNQQKAAEISRLETVIAERDEAIQGTKAKLHEAEGKKDELSQVVQQGVQRQRELEDTVSTLRTTVVTREAQITTLQKEMNVLSEQFSKTEAALQAKVQKADNEIAVSRGAIATLKKQRDDLTKTIEDERAAKARLEKQLTSEIEKIASALQVEKDALKKKTEDLRSVSEKLQQTERLRSEASKEAQELREKVGTLQGELQAERERVRVLETTTKDLRADVEKLQGDLVQKHTENLALAKAKDLLTQKCREQEDSLSGVRAELQSVRVDLAERDRRIEIVEQERERLKAAMEEAQREGDIRAAWLSNRVTELEGEAATLTKERGELIASLQALQLDATETERQLAEARTTLLETQRDRDQCIQAGKEVQTELVKAQVKVAELEQIVQNLGVESHQQGIDLVQTREEYDAINEKFQGEVLKVEELQQQKQQLEAQKQQLEEREQRIVQEATNHINDLWADRHDMQVYGANLRQQLIDCRKKDRELTGSDYIRPPPLPRFRR
jgi:chromosome segregation ATPase